MSDDLEPGRRAFATKAWREAHARLARADETQSLQAADLERLGIAAYLIGLEPDSDEVLVRAHQRFLDDHDPDGAARCARWLEINLLNRGEEAGASGWHTRTERLVGDRDSVEHGYLSASTGLRHLGSGDPLRAGAAFRAAADVADRFTDPDLTALSRLGRGQVEVLQGHMSTGLALLDDAMVAVTTNEVSPIPAGIVYCAVIWTCHHAYDVRRAHEWTTALTRWCERQPDLVPYRGQCLVHRAQVMQWHGAWAESLDQASAAAQRLLRLGGGVAGPAFHQQAEIHRLRGEFACAEVAYHQASDLGHDVQPGLALMRLDEGRPDAAVAAIHRAVEEAADPAARARLLAASVRIMLTIGDVAAARSEAARLTTATEGLDQPAWSALDMEARGTVLLAEDDAEAALRYLRPAMRVWQELRAPYESARVQVSVGLACRTVGDEDAAGWELEAARQAFTRLGAVPDTARTEALIMAPRAPGGLSRRELEVLGLVAGGRTNRAIATELVVSEKTVARHISNIYAKLDVSSRAAATAYAYRNHLV